MQALDLYTHTSLSGKIWPGRVLVPTCTARLPSAVGPMTKTSEVSPAYNTTQAPEQSVTISMSQRLLPVLPAWERGGRTRPAEQNGLPLTRADMPSFGFRRWNLVSIQCFAARTTQRNRQISASSPGRAPSRADVPALPCAPNIPVNIGIQLNDLAVVDIESGQRLWGIEDSASGESTAFVISYISEGRDANDVFTMSCSSPRSHPASLSFL